MALDGKLPDDGQPQTSLSRRDFLRHGTLTGAAFAPGIVLLSGSANRDAAAAQSAGQTAPATRRRPSSTS